MMRAATAERTSPLYTPKAVARAKADIIRFKGKDLDGAFRAYGRLDDAADQAETKKARAT